MLVAFMIFLQDGEEWKYSHSAADQRDALLFFRDAKPVAEGQDTGERIALLHARKKARPFALDLITHAYGTRYAVI